jgi:hypothetical protein
MVSMYRVKNQFSKKFVGRPEKIKAFATCLANSRTKTTQTTKTDTGFSVLSLIRTMGKYPNHGGLKSTCATQDQSTAIIIAANVVNSPQFLDRLGGNSVPLAPGNSYPVTLTARPPFGAPVASQQGRILRKENRL